MAPPTATLAGRRASPNEMQVARLGKVMSCKSRGLHTPYFPRADPGGSTERGGRGLGVIRVRCVNLRYWTICVTCPANKRDVVVRVRVSVSVKSRVRISAGLELRMRDVDSGGSTLTMALLRLRLSSSRQKSPNCRI